MSFLSADELEKVLINEDVDQLKQMGGGVEIAKKIGSNVETGLDHDSIHKQRTKYGSNSLPYKDVPSIFEMLLDALNDNTLKILIVCAILSLVLETFFAKPEEKSTAWIDGAAILIAVAIVSIVQAISNHDQAEQFAKINRCNYVYRVHVVRGGEVYEINSTEVVVGDIVQLNPGDKIPADGVILSANSLEIDTSSATGESDSVLKTVDNPFIVSGTLVNQGTGTFLVMAVGSHSNFGRIFATLNEEQKPTPLQDKLEDLANSIGYAGMVVAAITFIALCAAWIVNRFRFGFQWADTKDLLDYLVGALTIVVVAVPEGLPLAVTISLAYSMKKMMKDNNFVRHIKACETMGSATVICTDKTGTLTMNEMNCESVIIGLKDHTMRYGELPDVPEEYMNELVKLICTNTTAIMNKNGNFGTQTECALLRFTQKHGADIEGIRQKFKPVEQFQFNTNRKTMSTVFKDGDMYTISVKGAQELILGKCTKYIDENMKEKPLTTEVVADLNKLINADCEKGYRMLAVASRRSSFAPSKVEDAEQELTLFATFAIRDSLRPSTPGAIRTCQKAGIRVIMVTGDNALTATTIARDCGIITNGRRVITGDDIRGKSPEEIVELVSDCCVVARSKPLDKYEVVQALQRAGEVVAVTGDGTNDAPALRKADVGLSMGVCGTELAKEASDIVILDDNFKSIVSSVMWGRCIFNNVRRFLQFQLTANVVTLFISFISSVILQDTPFKAVQLLWINLIMDSLGALALATSLPHLSLLDKPPNSRDAPLISDYMIQNIGSQSLYQIILMVLLLIFHGDIPARSVHHYSLIFNVFVFCQVFNLVNARIVDSDDKLTEGLLSNKLFLIIMSGISIVEWILIQQCGKFFAAEALSLKEWIFSLLIGFACIPYGVLVRSKPIALFKQISSFFTSFGRSSGKQKDE